MKRIFTCLLAAALLLPCTGALADQTQTWNPQTYTKLFPYAAQVRERAKDAVVMRTGVNCALVRGGRTVVDQEIKVTPEEKDGTVFIPAAFTAQALGAQVQSTADGALRVTAAGGQLICKPGEEEITVDGTVQKLPGRSYLLHNVLMVPAQSYIEALGKKVTVTDGRETGSLIVVSDTAAFFQDGEEHLAYELICQMAYQRPSGKQLLNDIAAKHPNNGHPRLMATKEDFLRIRKNVKTDEQMKKWFADTKAAADPLLEKDLGAPPLSSDWGKGNQMRMEITNLAAMYRITGEKKYADKVKDYLLYASDIVRWGPAQFLDVVEMASGIAIGYDWIYDALTPQERTKIRSAMVSKSLKPGLEVYRQDAAGAWPTRDTNWNIVCNGGLMLVALAIAEEEPDVTAEVFEYATRGAEYMLKQYAPEGGWHEGPTYWNYTDEFMVYFASGLMSAAGTDYGYYYNTQGMRHTGYYLFDMTGNVTIFNIHDADEQDVAPERMFFHADKMNDNQLAKLTMRWFDNNPGNALTLVFYQPEKMKGCEQASDPPLDGSYEAVAIAALRSSWEEKNGIYAALHGGYNMDVHGQVDAGDFVLDALGERWVCDPGKENYNLPNFWNYTAGGGRGSYYCNRPEGNNTIVVGPNATEGQVVDATAPLVDFQSKARGSFGVIDMSDVLGSGVKSARRGMMLFDDRSKVLIQDEIELTGEKDVIWFAHTQADITLSNDRKTAYLEKNGRKMQVSILSGAPSGAVFRKMEAEPLGSSPNPSGQKSLTGIHKLAIYFRAKGTVTLPVVFIPLEQEEAPQLPKMTSIQNWTIPDGTLTAQAYPKLESILVNGEPIENFSPDQMQYRMKLDQYDDAGIQIETKAKPGLRTEVEQTGSGKYRVKVQNHKNKTTQYTVAFSFAARPVPEGAEKLKIKNLTASSEPQPENNAKNAIDGDLTTRWSAEGKEEWLMAELTQEELLEGIGLSFMNGDKRVTYLDVELSADGSSWETIFSGESSGSTAGEEFFQAQGKRAKYVRIRCHGTSEGIWNSVQEFSIYRGK